MTEASEYRKLLARTEPKYIVPCALCVFGYRHSKAGKTRPCKACYGTGKMVSEIAIWRDIVNGMMIG